MQIYIIRHLLGQYQHCGEPRGFASGGEGVGDLQIIYCNLHLLGQYQHCGEPRGFACGGEGVGDMQIYHRDYHIVSILTYCEQSVDNLSSRCGDV